MDLDDKSALVCGSTQGIGQACAVELARRGATVILLARNAESLAKVQRELPQANSQSHAFVCVDFGDHAAVRRAAERAVEDHGPVQILVNNTGGPPSGPLVEAQGEALLKAFSMHVLCYQQLLQVVLPGMKAAGYGRIVNIISTSVIAPIAGLGVSNTIRAAVSNWARTLAGELGPFGITVNSVLPGYTDTARLASLIRKKAERSGKTVESLETDIKARIPLGRFAIPGEIAAAVGFLASPAASYVSGVNLPVDGGRTAAQ